MLESLKGEGYFGKIYEYAIAQFAEQVAKKVGEFYTPSSIVRTSVEILQHNEGRVYDPCCGSRVIIVTTADSNDGHWVSSTLIKKK
ncbi:MAG: N-6 DNA methylase [Clostridiaceae bacterium]|nr:N-6 DNA methylase [Clostridiaceae bacterium]